jgi:hypothetical protein
VSLLAIVIAATASLGVLLIVAGLTLSVAPRQGDLLEARLAQFTEQGRAPATLTEVELSLPLFERVVRPMLDGLGGFASRFLHAGSLEGLQEKLNLAGRPWGLTASGFAALRILSLMLFTCLGLAASVLLGFAMPAHPPPPAEQIGRASCRERV